MRLFSLIGLAVAGLPFSAPADIALNEAGTWTAKLETRLRFDSDMNAVDARGRDVEDRTRARVRALLGMKYVPDDIFTIETRLRSGASEGHQSSHVTVHDFDGGQEGETDIDVDKWAVGAKKDGLWGWIGRSELPFKNTEIALWDSDTTLPGAAGGYKVKVHEDGSVSMTAGVFALPVGMRDFSGALAGVDAAYTHTLDGIDLTVGGGHLRFLADTDDADGAKLPMGNGGRDYVIWTACATAEWKWQKLPVQVGVMLFHNGEDYDDAADAFTQAHEDERDGALLSFQIGSRKKRGEWLAAYHYAYIETLAINASYGPDDWQRWGTGSYNDASDVSGHQLHFGYAFTDSFNVLARLFLAEGIDSQRESTRIRLDLNQTF